MLGVVSHSQRSYEYVCDDRACVCVCMCVCMYVCVYALLIQAIICIHTFIWKLKRGCGSAVKRYSEDERRYVSVEDGRVTKMSNSTM